MKPSSFSTLAMATLILEEGMTTRSCRAETALRIRVSMSAMGSVTATTTPPLPTRLRYAGDLPLQRQVAEADATQREGAHVAARPAAQLAAVALAHRELRRPAGLDDHRYLCHLSP